MGRLVYWMNCALDGFVNDPNGEFDWGAPSEEVLEAINDEMEGVSTYLYGRRIYELMRVWELDPAFAAGDSPGSARFARLWREAEKIVYSTTLTEVNTARTRLERTFDPEAVRRLKAESAGDLTVDGPTLAAHALRHGLVAAGRYLHLQVRVPDAPGSLARLLAVLAAIGANVVHVEHDRTSPDLGVEEVDISVQVETRGTDHCSAVLAELRSQGFRILE